MASERKLAVDIMGLEQLSECQLKLLVSQLEPLVKEFGKVFQSIDDWEVKLPVTFTVRNVTESDLKDNSLGYLF